MVFCFIQNFFSGQHESYNIYFFCRTKREFFFQNLTLGYMAKTLNQIICFFLHQNQNIFFSNIGNQNIFLEKNHNPPFKLNGRSLICTGKWFAVPASLLTHVEFIACLRETQFYTFVLLILVKLLTKLSFHQQLFQKVDMSVIIYVVEK